MPETIQNNTAWLIIICGLLGLIVGSFLNVVIYRLPKILNNAWRAECFEFLQQPQPSDTTKFNLALPASHCPQCEAPVRAWQNIPIVSYLLLGGKCSNCKTKISWRYPLVELLSAIAAIILAWHFGFGWQLVMGLILSWCLISASFIDIDEQIIPDCITIPLIWIGLFINLFNVFCPVKEAIIGAIAGYLSLWIFAWIFKYFAKKDGMGHGDFKLFAVFGAWLGWQALPLTIFFAALLGSCFGILGIAVFKHNARKPIPFGPYLAFAGWIILLWYQPIIKSYWHFVGLS